MKQSKTLGKSERLRSRKLIEEVFGSGRSLNLFPLRIGYQFREAHPVPLQAGFGVSSRHFKKAVTRNKIKRLLREVYRHQKHRLNSLIEISGKSLVLFIIYVGKEVPTAADVSQKVESTIQKFEKMINEKASPGS